MLRRIRLFSLWCVLVLLVGVAPAVVADDAATPAAALEMSGEPAAVLVAEPSEGPGVVVADDPVRSVRYPLPVAGLPDPDAGRSGLVSGSATVDLAADTVVAAVGLPVGVELVDGKATEAAVSVLSETRASGVSPLGVAFSVDLEDPAAADAAGGAAARVVLDYSNLRLGYAAGLAGRLRILRGVDCRADELGVVSCAELLPVVAVNDRLARTLTFELADSDLKPVTAATSAALAVPGSGGGGFFVLSSGPSGEAGDFAATPLAVLTSYQVGLLTGHFEVSYPIGLPPAFWGPEPEVTLSYSSGSVDGLTGDLNTQAGWLGLGWDWQPGSVSRQFGSCSGSCTEAPGDLVPAGDLFSLSVAGVSSRLIEVDAQNGLFRLEADPEWRVELLSGASNGDQQGEYWVVTTPAGLRYTFGRETVSGSESAFVVPVYSPSGDGYGWCAGQSGDVCDKVWQWNLESIEDPNGYRVEFFYSQVTNWFLSGRNDQRRSYVRDGHLVRIDYGDGPGKDHHGRVNFTLRWRCEPTDSECDTWGEQTGSMTDAQLADGSLFPDVPVDLICAQTGSCTQQSPTFFSHRALGRITTQYRSGASWVDVDRWDLTFSFAPGPAGDTVPPLDPEGDASEPKLVLMTIQKMDPTAGGDDLNAVQFGYQWRPNRADYAVSGVSAQYMARLDSITNELNGVATVEYGKSADCMHGYPYYPGQDNTYDPDYNDTDPDNNVHWYQTYGDSNIRRTCDEFPGRDPLDGSGWAYWNKWKVLSLTQQASGESAAQTSTYTYLSYPTWHHWDNLVNPAESFWRDYRGHRQVQVTDSSGAYTTYTFYLGMKGDDLPSYQPYPEETFTTSESGASTRQDEDWLAGQQAEVYRHASGGSSLSRTVSYYTWDQTSAEDTWWSAPSQQLATTWGSATSVTTQTDYTYADLTWFHGLSDEIRRGVAGADAVRRTHTTYLQSTLSGYDPYYLPNQVSVFDAASGGSEVARTRYFYDGASVYTTRPGRGNLTRTRLYSQLSPSEVYADSLTSFDGTYLWPISSTDANGLVTAYTRHATYGYVSVETVQAADPDRDFITTTTLDPGRGLPLTVVVDNSPYDTKTSYAYDVHGRLTSAWKPTRHDTSGNPLSMASVVFTYSTPSSGMASVHAKTLTGPSGSLSWLHSYVYFDGFGRQIQTQAPDPAGGSLLTSTRYNSAGQADYTSGSYHSAATAGAAWQDPTWTAVGPYTASFYDGAGRSILVETWSGSTELWESTTAYGVTSGRTWTTQTDAEGRWLKSYANGHGELVLVEEPSGGDTSYTYTPRGELASVTNDYDTAGTGDDITIGLTYDLAGRKTAMSDPDSGDWSYTYDDTGNLITQVDGKGTELTFVRDDLGRVKERRDTTGANNTLLAAYTYDTVYGADYAVGLLAASQSGPSAAVADFQVNDYDADGLPLSQTWTLNGDTYTASYTYTADGKPATVVYPAVNDGSQVLDAETVTYGYDGAGRAYSITSSFDSSYTALRSWVYDSTTLRVSELRAGSYPYSSSSPETNLQRMAYTYDDTGLVTSLIDHRNAQQRQCNTYNSRGMLTRAFTGNSTCTTYDSGTGNNPFDQTYTYNAVGNITQLGSVTNWSYGTGNEPGAGDAGPHAVISAGGITYTYDDTGNQTTRTQSSATTTYTYNQDNLLTNIDVPATSLDWTFGYDADGNRVRVQHGTGAFTYYIGGLLEVDTSTSGGTVTQTRSIYPLGGGVTATRVNTKNGTWDPNGPDEIDYTFTDHLGSTASILEVLPTTPNPTYTRYLQRYYPWGEPRTTYTAGLPTDHTYTGQIADIPGTEGGNPSGLMYYNARYYNPTNGHFTQPDTIIPDTSDPQAYNRYQYVRNNPTNQTDPTGHCWWNFSGDAGCPGAGVAKAVANAVVEAGRRIKETGEYVGLTVLRRVTHPFQTVKDVMSGTAIFEDVAGLLGTASGGDVDLRNCPEGGTCIKGAATPFEHAWTIGHTVLIDSPTEPLTEQLRNHEADHIRYVEEVGGFATAVSSAVAGLVNLFSGSHDPFHEDLPVEHHAQRAESGGPYRSVTPIPSWLEWLNPWG